ncbi:MAG TPA: right-handed parallel beta-helix repeat-containing protein [Kofleriaceae bacterium]|jgi:hypothetical protein|nr:right-handed parallel beta-helix repeat-containing protein [Kofleriaceae bacterium]
MVRLLLLVVPLVALAGCQTENSAFCANPANAGMQGCPGNPSNGGPCSNNSECKAAGFPVCDTSMNGGMCVQCTTADSHVCAGMTPVCTPQDTCTACTKHADCMESNACMPDGSCALSTDVAYVDGSKTDNPMCTKQMPCTKLDKALAAKPIVKVTGTVMDRVMLNNRNGTILADPGATLQPPAGNDGTLLDIRGTSDLKIYDLQISNATGGSGVGVSLSDTSKVAMTRVTISGNGDRGIQINNNTSSSLTCTQCVVASNGAQGIDAGSGSVTLTQSMIHDNTGGGIHIAGSTAFHIVSNFVYNNGSSTKASAAGIIISVDAQAPGAAPNQLDFNSVSGNKTVDMVKGIQCTSGTPLVATSNLVWSNGAIPLTDAEVVGTQCSFMYSDVGPAVISGVTNISMDPGFKDLAGGNLHLNSGSPALGKADPTISLGGLAAKDIDGEARVARTGMGADVGADQYYPPGMP